jgi:Zn-dependent protease with chaperone function
MQVNPARGPNVIVNPLTAGGLASLFSTPPMAERIKRLQELAMRSG